MVDSDNTFLNPAGTFPTFFFAGLQVVVVSIGTHRKFSKQPAHTELLMIFLDELILSYSISFAKNAAAFFRN